LSGSPKQQRGQEKRAIDVPNTRGGAKTFGSSRARISTGAVQLFRKYTGRGPSQAQTTLDGDALFIVMRETLTAAELNMISAGQKELVMELRQASQEAMRPELVKLVEENVHRRVVAFISIAEANPDIAVEVFRLEPAGK
jgi:uncharacterized protein YbcI